MIKGFRDFLLRGNVVDLAVAVVVGAAFGMVVQAIVKGFISPLIAAVFGEPDLSSVGTFEINDAVFSLGLILDALINFVLVAAAVYFFVVVPVNHLMEARKRGQAPEADAVPEDVAVLQEIRDILRNRPI